MSEMIVGFPPKIRICTYSRKNVSGQDGPLANKSRKPHPTEPDSSISASELRERHRVVNNSHGHTGIEGDDDSVSLVYCDVRVDRVGYIPRCDVKYSQGYRIGKG